MAFVSNPRNNTDITLDPYISKSPKLQKIIKKVGIEKFDEFCYLIYLIRDPRSDYFDVKFNKNESLKLIFEDFPNYVEYANDSYFLELYDFLDKVYDTDMLRMIRSITDLAEKMHTSLNTFKMPDLTKKENAELVASVVKIMASTRTQLIEYQKLANDYIRWVKEVEVDFAAGDFSILERKHITESTGLDNFDD